MSCGRDDMIVLDGFLQATDCRDSIVSRRHRSVGTISLPKVQPP